MKAIFSVMVMLTLALAFESESEAGADRRRFLAAPRHHSGVTFFAHTGGHRVTVQRYVYGAYPYYYQPPVYHYWPNYPPVVVISPYAPAYVLPPTVVVNAPYFCLLHNDGFVSRVGLLDHLAGTHKIPLEATTSLCPDGAGSCLFPSY